MINCKACDLTVSSSTTFRKLLPLVCVSLLATLAGCTHSSTPHTSQLKGGRSSVSSSALLEDVARTLNRLDEATVIDLTPPELVLDATTSRNRKEVEANFIDDPRKPNGRFDILAVTTNNGQFDRLNIGPGDQVRIFVDLGEDEFNKISTINMVVAETFNADLLRVEQNPFLRPPFNGQLPYPARIEIWRYSNDRLRDLGERFQRFTEVGRANPGFNLPRSKAPKEFISTAVWEPAPDEAALTATLDRLNQWGRDQKPDENWKPNPLIATLPEQYLIFLSPDVLAEDVFTVLDVRNMQEAVWARDIGSWAARDSRFTQSIWGTVKKSDKEPTTAEKNAAADLDAATALFDWTVRDIQLDRPEDHSKVPHQVWHTLLYGRGTLEQRTWVFIRLARQQGLDVVALAVGSDEAKKPKALLAGLLLGDQIYLFDLQLGLPLPGPGGKGICTLQQLQKDPQLLRQLDLSESEAYPLQAADLKTIVAMIDSTPLSLSERGQKFEAQLVGRTKFAITGLDEAAVERLQNILGKQSVQLWDLPYRTLTEQLTLSPDNRRAALMEYLVYSIQPWLYKARVLHFQGKFDFEMTKKLFLPPNTKHTEAELAYVEKYETFNSRFFYRKARPGARQIEDPRRQMQERVILTIGKINASYWLGLLALDDGDTNVAIDFLGERTLAAIPGGPWTWSAQYNLGRARELLGDEPGAAKEYELSPDSPQSFGNRVRARRLMMDSPAKPAANTSENTQPSEPAKENADEPKSTAEEPAPAKADPEKSNPAKSNSEKANTEKASTEKLSAEQPAAEKPATEKPEAVEPTPPKAEDKKPSGEESPKNRLPNRDQAG